jgi:hypothetical protein
MRLLNTRTLELEEFYGDNIPKEYSILSHTWENEELAFQDWKDRHTASLKAGFKKIIGACDQAVMHGFDYLWIDTICIDKTSSAELSEAINSMFAWYRGATVCYAYLVDVPHWSEHAKTSSTEEYYLFKKSRWFTRGWTLQELLAPKHLTFYARDWSKIGTRSKFSDIISPVTQIDSDYLTGRRSLGEASVAKKMSWLSRRVTTRVEDMAYCVLGIFDINMPLLYGEGSRAFVRLQEEIIKVSNDQTIFSWSWTNSVPSDWVGMLAPCPDAFKFSGHFIPMNSSSVTSKTYAITNAGLSIKLALIQTWSYYLAMLDIKHDGEDSDMQACIPIRGSLQSEHQNGRSVMQRIAIPPSPLFVYPYWTIYENTLFIRQRPDTLSQNSHKVDSPSIPLATRHGCQFLLVLDDVRWFLGPTLRDSTALKSHGDLYLLERCRDYIGIKTYPPAMFDNTTSLVELASEHRGMSGVLVKLGQTMDSGCIVFLGSLKAHRSSGEERFVCQVFPPEQWGPREDDSKRRRLLRRLYYEDRTSGQTDIRAGSRFGFHARIHDRVAIGNLTPIWLVYITSDRRRLKYEDLPHQLPGDVEDIDNLSLVPGIDIWEA